MECPPHARFLLIRTDKIGDLILTTPAIQVLKARYPNSFIAFLCSSYAAGVLENNPYIDLIIRDEKNLSFFKMVSKIKKLKFDVAVHFYMDWKSSWITTLAKIPLRIGPRSKPASILLNLPIKQKRSSVEKHEAEYNLDLVKFFDAEDSTPPSIPQIFLQESESANGKKNLAKILKKDQNKKTIFIHPGSKGSAQNWPLTSFLGLAKMIADQGLNVILTGGKDEEEILKTVEKFSHPHLYRSPSNLLLRELAAIIQQGQLMISNSTGPLHMASALGVQTLSFYPRIPITTSSKRWGPYPPSSRHTILTPKIQSDSLSTISVKEAFQITKKILNF